MYNDNFKYPLNTVIIDGQKFDTAYADYEVLKLQRESLSMSQRQVADSAGIQLRQYQRFESGERSMSSASLRIGLSICDVLKLDPHRFISSAYI